MITQKDIEHIARLARIDLTAKEKQRFENDLPSILEFVETLKKLDTEHIIPVTGGTDQKNVMRNDTEINLMLEGKAGNLLDAIQEKEENYAKVKAVFESHT